jgi:hypothetical protein
MDGGITSFLITWKEQVEELDDASVAVSVTVIDPVPVTIVPGAGTCVITMDAEAVQLSVAVARDLYEGSNALQLAPKLSVCAAGQMITGWTPSIGVTVKVHSEKLPCRSVATIFTSVGVVIMVPAAGICVLVIDTVGEQLSVMVASGI